MKEEYIYDYAAVSSALAALTGKYKQARGRGVSMCFRELNWEGL